MPLLVVVIASAIISVVTSSHGLSPGYHNPYLNPAGVTYINGPAPVGLVAQPVHYTTQQQTVECF